MWTVVVLDEDGAMKTLICEWLEAAGYRLGPLPSRDGADVGLVVLDLPSLRLHGAERVQEVRAEYPDAAVIGMSAQLGRSLLGTSPLAATLGVTRLLAKPLGRDELLAAAADAIGMAS